MLRRLCILLVASFLCASLSRAADPAPGRLLIRGNIVTPDGVVANGWLDIRNGRIAKILRALPADTFAVPTVETTDFIFPGFIDLHNHPSFNIFPRWTPPHKFPNRYAWRGWAVYKHELEDRFAAVSNGGSYFCDIDEYVEIKALIGGTTSMIGFSGHGAPKPLPDCIKGPWCATSMSTLASTG